MSYLVDTPPTADRILQTGHRTWELPEHRPSLTLSRGAFKTYSTYVISVIWNIWPRLTSSQHPPQVHCLDPSRCSAVNQVAIGLENESNYRTFRLDLFSFTSQTISTGYV